MTADHWSSRPTREGMVYILITCSLLAASFIQRVNLLVLVFGLMAAPLVIGWRSGRGRLKRLAIRRVLPVEAVSGAPFEIVLEATNGGRWRSVLGATAEDDFSTAVEQRPSVAAFGEITAKATRRAVYRVVAPRRGLYSLGPLTLKTRLPLGLVETRRRVPMFDELLVYPALGTLTSRWAKRFSRTNDASRRSQPAADGAQEDVHGVREYRFGDNPRHIHWRTTARRGQLVVKEFDSALARDVVLILEPWLPPAPSTDDRAGFESMISFVATAAVDLCNRSGVGRGGRLLMAIAQQQPIFVQGQASARLVGNVLRQLALVEGSPSADWRAALAELGPNQCGDAMVFLVGARPLGDAAAAFGARYGRRTAADLEVLDVSAGDLDSYFVGEAPIKGTPNYSGSPR